MKLLLFFFSISYLLGAHGLLPFYCHCHHWHHCHHCHHFCQCHLLYDIACCAHFLICLNCIFIITTPHCCCSACCHHNLWLAIYNSFTNRSLACQTQLRSKIKLKIISSAFCLSLLHVSSTDYRSRAMPIGGALRRPLRRQSFREIFVPLPFGVAH